MKNAASGSNKLHIEFSIREPETERYVTFSDDVDFCEVHEWFIKASLGVEHLFNVRGAPSIVVIRNHNGNKINAIKAVRTITNCGLKNAKDLVEGNHYDVPPGQVALCSDSQAAGYVRQVFQNCCVDIEFTSPRQISSHLPHVVYDRAADLTRR